MICIKIKPIHIFPALFFFFFTSCASGNRKEKDTIDTPGTDTIIKEERVLSTGGLDRTLSYVNGKLNGPVTYYYPNGVKRMEQFYKDSVWTGEMNFYTLDHKLASQEWWVPDPAKKDNWLLKDRKIYWQEVSFIPNEFLFVSDTGFYMVKNGQPLPPDAEKPDNIIETEMISDGTIELFIWKDGHKTFYKQIEKE